MVGDDDAVGTETHGILGVFRVENALDDHRPVPEIANPLQVFPGDRGVEIVAQPADIVGQVGRVAAISGDVAQIVRPTEQAHIQRPGRMGHGLQYASQGRVRAAHAGVGIAVASAGHGHVHGKYQGGDAGGLGSLQGVFHKAAVFEHIQLEPHGPANGRRHLFNRAHRDGRQGKGDAFAGGGLGRLHFTAPRVHAGQPDRGQRQRHGQGFAQQLGFQVELRHVTQYPLAQGNVGQVADVAAQGVLGVGATVDVVKQKRRQLALGRGAVVSGGGNDHGVHSGVKSQQMPVANALGHRADTTPRWLNRPSTDHGCPAHKCQTGRSGR